jgi:hypothetical protein
MAKRPTIAERRSRLSPRVALAIAARDAEHVALKVAARAARSKVAKRAQAAIKLACHEAAVTRRRAAEKARRDADLPRFHAKARRCRLAHPEVEAARQARSYAAKKARAIEAAVALAIRLDREAQREAKAREYNTPYQAKRRARLAAESCQASS